MTQTASFGRITYQLLKSIDLFDNIRKPFMDSIMDSNRWGLKLLDQID